MCKSIEDYIRKFKACQKGREDQEFKAPLGEAGEPVAPFQPHPWI